MDYYIASVADVARLLGSSPAGLSPETAAQRLTEYGENQIADAKQKTIWQMLGHQLTDVMILVLIAAAVISSVVGEVNSSYVIVAIIVLNAIVGFVQEFRAEKAMKASKRWRLIRRRCGEMGKPAPCRLPIWYPAM